MHCSCNRANAASTHFVKAEGKSPILVSFAPKSKPQELPVSGKDGDMEVCRSFRLIVTNQSSDLICDTTVCV